MIYKVKTSKDYETAVADVKSYLSEIGFGVLWEINFKDKLNEKGLEFDQNYKVLEVCNPKKAQQVLNANKDIGHFLPCKVSVFESGEDVFIGMPEPTKMMSFIDQPEVLQMAREVELMLKEAIDKAK